MKKRLIIALLLTCMAGFSAFSAGKDIVEGYVLDGNNGVPNVTVKTSVKDKTVKTNKKGYFRVKGLSAANDTLFMEIPEKDPFDIPLEGRNLVTVQIMGSTMFIQKEKKVPPPPSYGGTVVTREELEKTGEQNLLRAISMKVTGVKYVDGNLIIRGLKSFHDDNNYPLYILDGVKFGSGANKQAPTYLTVMEVETVEVLKDASSSLFGIEGGAGVVIINRRK